MRKICAVSFITFVFSTIASAQLPSGGDAFFGYSYVHGEAFSNSRAVQASGGTASMNGWETSAEGKYFEYRGVISTLEESNVRSLSETLRASPTVIEFRLAPTTG